MRNILMLLSVIRLFPHLIVFNFHKNESIIKYDTARWMKLLKINSNIQMGFIKLMTFHPEYRNLFYNRIAPYHMPISWLCPKMKSLVLCTDTRDIGPGLFIQHGWSTLLGAKSIGKDCWILQNVSIVYANETDHPTIGDNVTIYCGAILIGDIKIGNNSIIGAGAVVVKDVPDNSVVVGGTTRIIRKNGVRVDEKL